MLSTAPVNLSLKGQYLLLFVVIANVLTLANELEFWLLGLLFLAATWRVVLMHRVNERSSKWMLVTFALLGCFILALTGRQLGLLLAMVHLLSFSYGLKMLELKQRKDFYQLVLIGLFILATSFIFIQSLNYFVVFIALFLLNVCLLLTYFSSHNQWQMNYWLSFKLLLQSVPLALALFLLFPKLAPFWQVPLAKSAHTGLSDQVSVGDIANLALSNAVAFRVDFTGDAPPYQQLYWRTLVLDKFDGKSWRQTVSLADLKRQNFYHKNNRNKPQISINHPVTGIGIEYQVFAEASFQQWLFALDVAKTPQSDIISRADFSLYRNEIISQTYNYQLVSYLQAPLNIALNDAQQRQNTALPQNTNPKLWQEGQRLRQHYQNDEQLIAAVLSRFRNQPYRYTLRPPLLGKNALDEFYFHSQAGFCQHYASSFAFLMRAAKIPTRLVVGYMGGEFNKQGQFYTIKQRDAHAWTEVWLTGKGWQRVDPTAAVSPDRVEQGFSDALFAERASLTGELFNFAQLSHVKWLSLLKMQLDSLDYQWTKWVVGYNANKQMNLLSQWFGQVKLWKSAVAIALTLMVTMILLMLFNRNKKQFIKNSPWFTLYLKLLKDIEKKGLIKNKTLSAQQFSQQVSTQWPALSLPFSRFSQSFITLQYQQVSAEKQQQLLTVINQQYKECKLVLKQQKSLA